MKDVLFKPFAVIQRRSRSLLAGAPVDLLLTGVFVFVATVLLAVVDVSSQLVRAAIGFPLLFLVPGYVTVSMLFPRETPARGTVADTSLLVTQTRAISDIERAALSFGLSFALLPLLGLVIAATPWGFTQPVVVGTVSCFALIGASIATARRLLIARAYRYEVQFGRRLEALHAAIFDTKSTIHTAVNVALVLSMLLALTSVGYALMAPQQGEQYTSLQLLTENESGELVASGYPEEIQPGESIPLVIGVENQEQEDMNYTVVVQEQRIEDGEVVERTELRRIDYIVNDGGTAYGERDITPTTADGPVRISILLYQNEVPDSPTQENAYRYTHIWTEVTDSAGADAAESDEVDDAGGEEGGEDEDDGEGVDEEEDEVDDGGGEEGGEGDGGGEEGGEDEDGEGDEEDEDE
ncbi:DUF1616 domain-containing protein [Halosolutus halophilus]|uniref:DUF1616 domain-containing protein n=1 Tax=Halosolutus halophilus TaxID=1552990 RepID=UPI0022352F7A|nr:DUF1616 domain-containing protein [Halosolutus halophilus]